MANDNEFVRDRLGALEDQSFRPNAMNARVRLRMQEGPRPRRWVWRAAAACAVLAVMLAMPSGRAIAQQGAQGLAGLHHALMEFHNALYTVYLEWMGRR